MSCYYRYSALLLVLVAVSFLAAGCTMQANNSSQESAADAARAQADRAFADADYHAASGLYALAQENYTATGDTADALLARNRGFESVRMTLEFPYNRSAIEAEMVRAFPNASAAQRAAWLDANMTATLKSDGEVWYFYDTVNNVRYHNPSLIQADYARANHTPLYDEMVPLIAAPWKNGTGPYGEPVTYTGVTELDIPRGELPANGTLKIWMPVPITSGTQTNVTILSVEPARYVKSSTGTGADIGLVYLGIPLEEITDPFLNVTARFSFVQHEQRVAIDPAKVLPYNTTSPEYLKYTASGKNIVITPAMKAKAQEIVGNETNPYLQAQKIYWHIVDTHPYSHAPHLLLSTSGTPESAYVLDTGIGDCGSQSMYFAALCRSLGIPARAIGGYQMIRGSASTHFWAEYYLEGYGWVPVDVTVAEGGTWSYNATPADLHRYQGYFFGSLDPYRYIIQNDVDIPLTPDPGNAVLFKMVVQTPISVCDTCPDDVDLTLKQYATTTVKQA